MTLTVAALIEQLQQLPDPTAPVAFFVNGVEYGITAVSLSTMRVHTVNADLECDRN